MDADSNVRRVQLGLAWRPLRQMLHLAVLSRSTFSAVDCQKIGIFSRNDGALKM